MQTLTEDDIAAGLSGSNRAWAYNGCDCTGTAKVQSVLDQRLARDPDCKRVCDFQLACQAPALTMMLRGAAIDERACAAAIKDWEAEEVRLVAECNKAIAPIWDRTETRKGKCDDAKPHRWSNAKNLKPDVRDDCDDDAARCIKCGVDKLTPAYFNPLSSVQVIRLLYVKLELPKQHSRKGDHGVTADDDAIDKLIHLRKTTDEQATILRAILAVRRARKQIGFLKSRRSSDGRLRQSVNVGATETGRWSASKDPFREGTNFQNIADRSRNIIVADPGLWLGYADLKAAESTIVAYDSEDQAYIDAHHSGDVHTFVAKMVWPELAWPGNPEGDREVADQHTPFDPDHSYRDYAKHVQHGGNIGQSAHGMARDAHIKVADAEKVYERMYGVAFPSVRSRQKEIMATVKETGILVTPLGRKRQFFGRLWEPATQREGMAQTQQSTVADLLNVALWRIWAELDAVPNVLNAPRPSDPNKVWLLAQVHDAILFLMRPHDHATLQRLLKLMEVPILIHGKLCKIETEVQLGKNFRHFNPRKPETVGGLADWKFDKRTGRIRIFNTSEDLK